MRWEAQMKRRRLLSILMVGLFVVGALSASAQTPDDETSIRALIDDWYAEHRAGPNGRVSRLRAPGAIDASTGYFYPKSGSAALGKPVYSSLAHRALQFTTQITRLKVDPRYARADVWERGYFYAFAVQETYENAGSATFVLEKQDNGRWLVLAHQTNTVGIPANMKTDPLPDLRDFYYKTEGAGRDPERDARDAKSR
jgi:ketosteroid isomerase-like protein